MTACGVAVLGVLVLIVYELMSRSRLSWHAFGLKFFAGSDWDPVSEQFGALPFIYGTLVSSLFALGDRGSAVRRRRGVYHRDVPQGSARAAFLLPNYWPRFRA